MNKAHDAHSADYSFTMLTQFNSCRTKITTSILTLTHTQQLVKSHLHLGFEEKYFSEGRDNLDGDSLLTSSLELGFRHFSSRIWYGKSSEEDYNELQFTIGLQEVINNTEFYIEYTHLQLTSDNTHDNDNDNDNDNEIGIGTKWSGLPLDLSFSIDGYHSFNAEGSFWELSLNRELQISDKLSLTGMTVLGVNQGYVSDGHDGANHLALLVESTYAMTKSASILTHAGYSWALKTKPELSGDDSLVDTLHGGINLQWSF